MMDQGAKAVWRCVFVGQGTGHAPLQARHALLQAQMGQPVGQSKVWGKQEVKPARYQFSKMWGKQEVKPARSKASKMWG